MYNFTLGEYTSFRKQKEEERNISPGKVAGIGVGTALTGAAAARYGGAALKKRKKVGQAVDYVQSHMKNKMSRGMKRTVRDLASPQYKGAKELIGKDLAAVKEKGSKLLKQILRRK